MSRAIIGNRRLVIPASRTLFGNSASAALNSWYARSFIAGRDGTVTTTRATQRTNPIDGSLLGNNVPATATISLGGLPLTLYGCWGQRTNLFLNSGSPATQNITVAIGSVCIYSRGSGFTFTTSAGTATATGYAASVAPGTPNVLTVTVAGTITVTITGTPSGSVQVEQAAFPGPYIPTAGASVTHNADLHTWAVPGGISGTGEMTSIHVPYLWSAAAGVQQPSGTADRIWDATNALAIRFDTDSVQRQDSALAVRSLAVTSQADASGSPRLQSHYWDTSILSLYRSGNFSGSLTAATPPWLAPGTLYLGNRAAGDRSLSGFVGLVWTPNGLTPAERAALQSLRPAQLAFAA